MPWGLEIGPETIRLCRAALRRGHLLLQRRVELPVPPDLVQPSLKETNLREAPRLVALLTEARRKARVGGWLRVVLPDAVFTMRSLTTDQLPDRRDDARRLLRWQARDLLPFPADEARLDYLPLAPGPEGRRRTVCLVARERVLAEYEAALAQAGLQVAVLDAQTIALAQAAGSALRDGPAALLAVNGTRTTLLVVHEGLPRFWRQLPGGRDSWVDGREAQLLREVADSLTFCQESERTGSVKHVVVSGLGRLGGRVSANLTDWLGIPAAGLDLTTALRAGGDADDLAAWGAALGAAIRPW
jgi:Tfp pilus assembly PilM family ATPase